MSLYKIADLLVEHDCSSEPTASRCEAYKASLEGEPDIVIRERQSEAYENFLKNKNNMSVGDWEYAVYGGYFYRDLLNFGGMLLHASAVVVDGKAYLFSAHSGTGKSTHTSIYLKLFGERAFIINDDKPAIRFVDGKFYVYGTPFSGKHDISRNVRAELSGICFLKQSENNVISELDSNAAIMNIIEQTVRKLSLADMDKMLSLLDMLLKTNKVYMLECNMDDEAAILSYETMSGEKYNG